MSIKATPEETLFALIIFHIRGILLDLHNVKMEWENKEIQRKASHSWKMMALT